MINVPEIFITNNGENATEDHAGGTGRAGWRSMGNQDSMFEPSTNIFSENKRLGFSFALLLNEFS